MQSNIHTALCIVTTIRPFWGTLVNFVAFAIWLVSKFHHTMNFQQNYLFHSSVLSYTSLSRWTFSLSWIGLIHVPLMISLWKENHSSYTVLGSSVQTLSSMQCKSLIVKAWIVLCRVYIEQLKVCNSYVVEAEWLNGRGSIPSWGKKFFSTPHHPDSSGNHPVSYSMGTDWGLFPQG